MQDPERFLDEGTDFERALLQGGKVERPSARVVRRMAIGAGVGGALSYTSSAQALMQSWWGKTVAVALVGGGVAVGVAGALDPEAAQVPSSAAGPNPAPARASQAALPAAPRPEEPAGALAPAHDPDPPSRAEARTAAAPKPVPRAKSASTLADEVKLLDRVRALMARGDQASALRELDGYDQRYPEGTLRREARVLRARANDAP